MKKHLTQILKKVWSQRKVTYKKEKYFLVIIENLKKNLPSILRQHYDCFEVIVVNDNSSDNSLEILLEFQFKFDNFTVVNLQQATLPGKKEALSAGIKQSRFDIVLLTDADCRPSSEYWIEKMQEAINDPIEIGLGHGPFFFEKSFLKILDYQR